MKYIKELAIILLFSFLGEALNYLIPLPVPASIYGMILLFIALSTKIVKLEQIEKTGEFLLSVMLIFFVPASVGIMDTFFKYKSSMLYIIIIVVTSTIAVIIATGMTSQIIIKLSEKRHRKIKKEGK
ncbi:MAG: CidA/LrgA family protein [Bacilli bacterium]|nr:CidA/LrgA family protein [Bacilli bacterium]